MSTVFLPTKLRFAIRELLPANLHNSAFKLLEYIFRKAIRKNRSVLGYTYFSTRLAEKILRTRSATSSKTLTALIGAGILEVKRMGDGRTYLPPMYSENGEKQNGICRNIRINPDLLFGPVDTIRIRDRGTGQRKKLDPLENMIRAALEKMRLPFEGEEISPWVDRFVWTPEFQEERILSRITEVNTETVEDCPSEAYTLPKNGDNEKPFVSGKSVVFAFAKAGRLFKYQKEESRKPTYYLVKTKEELIDWVTREIAISYKCQLTIINEAKRVAKVYRNKTNKRVDTALTNLYSKFLALITVNGDYTIAGIDLANSQFLIFAAILSELMESILDAVKISNKTFALRPEFASGSPIKGNNDQKAVFGAFSPSWTLSSGLPRPQVETLFLYLYHVGGITTCETTGKLLGYYTHVKKAFSDLQEFVSVCRKGELYEHIAARRYFGRDFGDLTAYQRDLMKDKKLGYRNKAKNWTMSLSFDKYDAHKDKPEKAATRDILLEIFPNVVGIIEHFKKCEVRRLYRLRKENFNHYEYLYTRESGELKNPYDAGNAAFAVMLQERETFIMVDNVIRKVIRKYWATGKHDSTLCLENKKEPAKSDFPKVLKIVRAELDRFFGPNNYTLRKETYSYDPETLKIRASKTPC